MAWPAVKRAIIEAPHTKWSLWVAAFWGGVGAPEPMLKCLSLSEINERGELVLSLKSDKLDTSQTMTREQLRYLVARGEFVLQKDGENAKNLPSGN